ncbi:MULTISPECIES: hypothetical protein [Lactococcus]|uniref:hypothetical protein n=1 Tax=Lactococcus TaxID=1357 RepID=UPI001CE36F4B|nr:MULTISPECIES: hypothetical protein [Lactococcus]
MESKLTEARRSLRNAKILAEMEMPLSAINNVNNAIELFEKEMEQHRLSIPKKIAEELEELTGKTNWESTPYSVIEEKGKINTWAYLGHGKCSEQLYKFCRDNTRLMHAYLNPLTRPFVEVTDE